MKLLYLDVDAQYMNPTAALLPAMMSMVASDARFFGPGFSSPDELRGGVRRWVDAHGPFDVVMIGPFIPFFTSDPSERSSSADFVLRYTVHPPFTGPDLRRYFDDVLDALGSLPIPVKVVTSLALDTYNSTASQVARVVDQDVYVFGPNHRLTRSLAEWPDGLVDREAHYQRKRDRLTDAWFDFLAGHPERVLTACHYIGEPEFCRTGLDARAWDIAVPGVEYALRRDAIASLAASGLRVAPKRYFHAFRVASRLGIGVHRHFLTARLYRELFHRTLCDSRLVFTAPGASGLVLRKFFEIPAAGAVLVCAPCKGFDALGFVDGRNCIVSEPGALASTAAAVRRSPDLQGIADAGRDLVMRRHSLGARATQLAQCLDAVRAGSYRGAEWKDGEFILSPAAVAA